MEDLPSIKTCMDRNIKMHEDLNWLRNIVSNLDRWKIQTKVFGQLEGDGDNLTKR